MFPSQSYQPACRQRPRNNFLRFGDASFIILQEPEFVSFQPFCRKMKKAQSNPNSHEVCLPNIDPKDVKIKIDKKQGLVSISAEKQEEKKVNGWTSMKKETFSQEFSLPQYLQKDNLIEQVKCRFRNGKMIFAWPAEEKQLIEGIAKSEENGFRKIEIIKENSEMDQKKLNKSYEQEKNEETEENQMETETVEKNLEEEFEIETCDS